MKKMLLTSDGFVNPNIGKRFLEMLDKDLQIIKVLFITTAAFGEREMSYVYESEKELINLGILKENIIWVSNLENVEAKDYDVVYVCGGNTFYLLNEMQKTDFCKKIIDFVERGKLYIGVSAGSIIVCPDVSISAPFDENSVGIKDTKGLNIISRIITPHYQRKEKEIIDEYEKKLGHEIVRLNDGQALEIFNGKEKLIS